MIDWHDAQTERPSNGSMVIIKRQIYVTNDRDRYAVCKAGRTLYTFPFYPFDRKDNIPWSMVDKWAYLE